MYRREDSREVPNRRSERKIQREDPKRKHYESFLSIEWKDRNEDDMYIYTYIYMVSKRERERTTKDKERFKRQTRLPYYLQDKTPFHVVCFDLDPIQISHP